MAIWQEIHPPSSNPLRLQDGTAPPRSEEHTSELQSLMRISYAVFCLKKKQKHTQSVQRANELDSGENSWQPDYITDATTRPQPFLEPTMRRRRIETPKH